MMSFLIRLNSVQCFGEKRSLLFAGLSVTMNDFPFNIVRLRCFHTKKAGVSKRYLGTVFGEWEIGC